MSAFICAQCDNLRDADDGCDEAPDGYRLICIDCMSEDEDAPSPPADHVVGALRRRG